MWTYILLIYNIYDCTTVFVDQDTLVKHSSLFSWLTRKPTHKSLSAPISLLMSLVLLKGYTVVWFVCLELPKTTTYSAQCCP